MNKLTADMKKYGAEYYTDKVYDMFMRYDDAGELFNTEQEFTRDGIAANVQQWLKAKEPLFDMFRHHPNWNEEAKAIVFLNTEHRQPDPQTVRKTGRYLISQGCSDYTVTDDLYTILNNIIKMQPMNVLSEEVAESINELIPDVKAVKGQKTSRIFNKLFTMFGIDKNCIDYNRKFAQLADACNPLDIERITVFSLNIIDFLLMSNGNSWRSCHTIIDDGGDKGYGGCYRGGTLSYANDGVTICMYTVNKNYYGTDWCFEPKITRQIFFWDYPVLVQERLYPQDNDNSENGKKLCNQYRQLAENVFAVCCGYPNLWVVERANRVRICSRENTFMYHDWDSYPNTIVHLKNDQGSVTLEIDEDMAVGGISNYVTRSAKQIFVGGKSFCIQCGEHKTNGGYYDEDDTKSLLCADCYNKQEGKFCCECGGFIDDDNYIIYNDQCYCLECCTYCDYHEMYEPDSENFTYVTEYGNVCEDALENSGDFYCCDECGEWFYNLLKIHRTAYDTYICDNCFEMSYYVCGECGEIYRNTDIIEVNGDQLCKECAESVMEDQAI